MTMEIQFILISLCVTLAASIDLGPYIRIAQCRSACVKELSVDGSCDSLVNSNELVCNECWHHCEKLEFHWETYKDLCEYDVSSENCSSCKTVCNYRNTRVMEEYLPSTLPAPEKPPTSWKKCDIGVLLKKVDSEWKESGYYPGSRITHLRPNMWLIVISGDGIKHYTYDEWVPTLDSLKPGALYEANISWYDIESQIREHNLIQQKDFNDRIRQFYLEKYGRRVVRERNVMGNSQSTDSMFKIFFFKKRPDKYLREEDIEEPSTRVYFLPNDNEYVEPREESWVVAWEPEAGGLMGNQEADLASSAQITLLPGTKYRVRVASKDGPGSFPIEVDTGSSSVQIHRLKKNFENLYAWGIIAASTSMLIFITVFVIIKLLTKKSKKIAESEEEVEEVV